MAARLILLTLSSLLVTLTKILLTDSAKTENGAITILQIATTPEICSAPYKIGNNIGIRLAAPPFTKDALTNFQSVSKEFTALILEPLLNDNNNTNTLDSIENIDADAIIKAASTDEPIFHRR